MENDRKVIVIALDAPLRDSITFLLEAEGYEVTAHDHIPPWAEPVEARTSCAIVDEGALRGGDDIWARLGRVAEAFVMLVSGALVVPPSFSFMPVEKPLLGQSVVEAVARSIRSRSHRST